MYLCFLLIRLMKIQNPIFVKISRKINVPAELFYKDSMGIVSKRFFKGGQYVFPTILGLRDLSYRFRFSGIDANILAEIKSKLKE